MVWIVWSYIFLKHPFRQLVFTLFILFFKIILRCLRNISSVARNWINSVPQTAAMTFAFFSVFILLLCIVLIWKTVLLGAIYFYFYFLTICPNSISFKPLFSPINVLYLNTLYTVKIEVRICCITELRWFIDEEWRSVIKWVGWLIIHAASCCCSCPWFKSSISHNDRLVIL